MEFDFVIVEQLAQIILGLLGGGAAVPIIGWVKDMLGLEGHWALLLTAVVATVVSTAALVVEGQLTPDAVNWANFGTVFLLLFAA